MATQDEERELLTIARGVLGLLGDLKDLVERIVAEKTKPPSSKKGGGR